MWPYFVTRFHANSTKSGHYLVYLLFRETGGGGLHLGRLGLEHVHLHIHAWKVQKRTFSKSAIDYDITNKTCPRVLYPDLQDSLPTSVVCPRAPLWLSANFLLRRVLFRILKRNKNKRSKAKVGQIRYKNGTKAKDFFWPSFKTRRSLSSTAESRLILMWFSSMVPLDVVDDCEFMFGGGGLRLNDNRITMCQRFAAFQNFEC